MEIEEFIKGIMEMEGKIQKSILTKIKNEQELNIYEREYIKKIAEYIRKRKKRGI